MIGRTNASGGGLTKSTLVVQTESGSTVTAAKGSEVRTAGERFGVWAFPGLSAGSWTVKAVKDGKTATKVVAMDGTASVMVTLEFNAVPAFTYTGEYELVDDNDNPINATTGNWKIRFLTSGTLKFTELRGAENGIDVFLVGGGGGGGMKRAGGGGGGYTSTATGISLTVGTSYVINVGAGGSKSASTSVNGGNGGATTGFGITAAGGSGGKSYDNGRTGGNGGSGGGGGEQTGKGGIGGTDGSNGEKGGYAGGTGQGTTTKEFGEASGKLYSTGGDGAGQDGVVTEKAGAANTGDGGSSAYADSYAGGSGIVVIRNAREAA